MPEHWRNFTQAIREAESITITINQGTRREGTVTFKPSVKNGIKKLAFDIHLAVQDFIIKDQDSQWVLKQ